MLPWKCQFFVYLVFVFFIGVQLLYNVVMVSVMQVKQLSVYIHPLRLGPPSEFLSSHPPRSSQSTTLSSLLCAAGVPTQLSVLHMVVCVYVSLHLLLDSTPAPKDQFNEQQFLPLSTLPSQLLIIYYTLLLWG